MDTMEAAPKQDIQETTKTPQDSSPFQSYAYVKDRSKFIKWKAIEELDKTLLSFETNFTNNGGKVIWASDSNEANTAIQKVLTYKQSKKVTSTNAPILEEIDFKSHCKKESIHIQASDLNSFLNQNDQNSNRPIQERSKDEIESIIAKGQDPENIQSIHRSKVSEYFDKETVVISGANFLSGDGAIICIENEGVHHKALAHADTLIYVIGIEKAIYSSQDLEILWPHLSFASKGNISSIYSSMNFGPQNQEGKSGPKEVYVVLVDNGRSELLKKPEEREALYDIGYMSNLDAMGSYSNHSKEDIDFGSKINRKTTIFQEFKNNNTFRSLSFTSLLYTAGRESSMNIDSDKLILLDKRKQVLESDDQQKNKWTLYIYKKMMLSRKRFNLLGNGLKNFLLGFLLNGKHSTQKGLPKFNKQAFHAQWHEQFK